jgi:tetratricopeptide (TPR) repeat protein
MPRPRLLVLGLALWVALAGCAPKSAPDPGPEPQACLSSPQCAPGPLVAALAGRVRGKSDLERLLGAMQAVGENLAYDPEENSTQFKRTAEQLFADKTLGGCSEFALAELAMFRAMGYPARLVLTVNAKWIARYKENRLAVPNGHGLIEVYVKGRWLLADPTDFVIYAPCPGPNLPGNEMALARALDFWDAGLTDVDQANDFLYAAAKAKRTAYAKPGCLVLGKASFDYPKAFLNLGRVFVGKGDHAVGLRLLRKAASLAPDWLPANLELADCLLAVSRPGEAAQYYRKALSLAPDDPRALQGLTLAEAALAAGNGQVP